MTDNTSQFEETLREEIQVKNLPNTRFENGQFEFIDYFDDEVAEAVQSGVNAEKRWADWAFEPYDVYLAGVEEITIERGHDDMYWYKVAVELPEDPQRQALLATTISDAFKRRQKR